MTDEQYKALILQDLHRCDYLRYDDKRVVGKRLPLLLQLESEGLITMQVMDVDKQESYLEIRRKDDA